jgi:AcrR family transcriptional regulator
MAIVNNDSEMTVIARSDTPDTVGYPRKRARTRRQLVAAGIAAMADHGTSGLTVTDIAARAGVASGTFYNHFASLALLVEAVTDELASGVEIARSALEQIEHDPAARVAIGTRQLLRLTRADAGAARAFVSLLLASAPFRTRVRTTVRAAVDDGVRAGRFVGRSTDLTTDAVLGAVVQWMRSALEGEAGPEPEIEHLRMILLVVGLPETDVAAVLDGVSVRRTLPT